jgi:hypothetical protein
VPDRRTHRGADPQDAKLFSAGAVSQLLAATSDLSWLYERGYSQVSALKLVGDRYALTQRQRAALLRCACAETTALARRARRVSRAQLAGAGLCIDGFNVLTTLEVALSGGVVLIGRDGCARDIAGVHGSYRQVQETGPALELLAKLTVALHVRTCEWLLDQPVSNSGRLCARIRAYAAEHELPWHARVVSDPDPVLAHGSEIVATADGAVLDQAARSFNLARVCIDTYVEGAFVVDLSGETSPRG